MRATDLPAYIASSTLNPEWVGQAFVKAVGSALDDLTPADRESAMVSAIVAAMDTWKAGQPIGTPDNEFETLEVKIGEYAASLIGQER